MKGFENYGLFPILMAVMAVAAISGDAIAQQSTTGPIPPPGIDHGLRPSTRDQVVIPDVPAYIWHHGCGPTAVGMVVGYWDGHGCPDLVPGDASGQTSAVDAMIADDSDMPNCNAPDGDHYQDYSCPIDASPGPLQSDRSELGGAHASNCVADFFMTSWSSRSNYYGWSWFSDVPVSFTGYVSWRAPHYNTVATNKRFNQFSWVGYRAEIDAGRPVVLLVDTDGNGSTDHFVTGIGYNDAVMEYGIYNTWNTGIHWFAWREIAAGNDWGIYGVTLFSIDFPQFVRGDVQADEDHDLFDAIYLLNWLGGLEPDPSCMKTADVQDDEDTDVFDALYLLNWLGGFNPPPPDPCCVFSEDCGLDPTPDWLTCESYPPCD